MNITSEDFNLTCCNDHQFRSIFLVILYAVGILKLWRIVILHPFKILTVFLHELGHALAAWLTCGKVTGMEVHPDEGGVTHTVGGSRFIILPAGYIGSALWGMGLLIASAGVLGSQIAAGTLIFFLALFIVLANNKYLRILNIGFIIVLSTLLAISIQPKINILKYVILFIGVKSCLFSIYDIYDDLLSRRINESDASVFAKLTHTSSRCWGVIWGLIAIATLAIAVYFHLLILQHMDSDRLTSFNDATDGTKAALGITCISLGLAIFHTIVTKRCMIQKTTADASSYTAV